MTKPSLKEVQEFVWNKYIEQQDVADSSLDDELALTLLEESFVRLDLDQNKDFYAYGVLLFEIAFADEQRQLAYFTRAKRVLEKYRVVTGERDWDVINDRLDDINRFLDDQGVLGAVESAGDILMDPRLDVAGFLEQRRRFTRIPEGMVLVPGGEFLFGAEKAPQTTEPFLLDAHPVTNGQYRAFLESTGYREPRYWDDARFNQPDQPVVGVSLGDCKKYAQWVSKDLPTEHQWEKAARGVDGRTYPWGEQLKGKGAHFDLDPSRDQCKAIGTVPDEATPYGCHEMAGFVWEWTKSPFEKGSKDRVLKGGAWTDDERFVRCAARLPAKEREKADNLGFRCCVNPE